MFWRLRCTLWVTDARTSDSRPDDAAEPCGSCLPWLSHSSRDAGRREPELETIWQRADPITLLECDLLASQSAPKTLATLDLARRAEVAKLAEVA
jgi:hypothetical protein